MPPRTGNRGDRAAGQRRTLADAVEDSEVWRWGRRFHGAQLESPLHRPLAGLWVEPCGVAHQILCSGRLRSFECPAGVMPDEAINTRSPVERS